MFARRYKSYACALLVGGVLGCSRPRWPATLNPTNSARAAAAERPTLIASLPRRRFDGGPWWGRECTSAGEHLVGLQRARPIALSVEQRDQATHQALVARRELD